MENVHMNIARCLFGGRKGFGEPSFTNPEGLGERRFAKTTLLYWIFLQSRISLDETAVGDGSAMHPPHIIHIYMTDFTKGG